MTTKKIGLREIEPTPEIIERVLSQIQEGISLRKICKEKGSPSRTTFYRWLEQDENLRGQYARARERQADTLADQILDVANEEPDPARARVKMDAIKWLAGKMKPSTYGDRVDHTSTDGSMSPQPASISFAGVAPFGGDDKED